MAQPNRYSGPCANCRKPVPAWTGYVEKQGRGRRARWAVWCLDCYNRSDASGAEDRVCGNRAYEDACAQAVGGLT
jgi:hypothetical protein